MSAISRVASANAPTTRSWSSPTSSGLTTDGSMATAVTFPRATEGDGHQPATGPPPEPRSPYDLLRASCNCCCTCCACARAPPQSRHHLIAQLFQLACAVLPDRRGCRRDVGLHDGLLALWSSDRQDRRRLLALLPRPPRTSVAAVPKFTPACRRRRHRCRPAAAMSPAFVTTVPHRAVSPMTVFSRPRTQRQRRFDRTSGRLTWRHQRPPGPGTATEAGYPEHTFTWDTTLWIRAALHALGVRTAMSRGNDDQVGPCVDERAAMANALQPNAVVSIHGDGGPATGRFHILYLQPGTERRAGRTVRGAGADDA